ncbi:hypothetical protein [Glutamicibacter halophytocola]|uniref:hypothetical protein n=1 Tax=Glutamicibacter halophytocola TaxID=1933880 RepID=UPI003D2CEC0A
MGKLDCANHVFNWLFGLRLGRWLRRCGLGWSGFGGHGFPLRGLIRRGRSCWLGYGWLLRRRGRGWLGRRCFLGCRLAGFGLRSSLGFAGHRQANCFLAGGFPGNGFLGRLSLRLVLVGFQTRCQLLGLLAQGCLGTWRAFQASRCGLARISLLSGRVFRRLSHEQTSCNSRDGVMFWGNWQASKGSRAFSISTRKALATDYHT